MVVAPLPRRRRGALFPAETDAAAPPQRRVRVEHDQKVGDLRAQLEAERRAHRADGRRRRPAAPREARHDQARAEPRGEGEARLRDAQKGLRANRAASPFSKRAVKDRAATSSSCYHEDGVEAMLDLCAAKGQAPRARQHVPPGARRRALEHLREDALGLRVIALKRRVDGPGPRERGPRVSTDAAPGPCRTPRPAETSRARAGPRTPSAVRG